MASLAAAAPAALDSVDAPDAGRGAASTPAAPARNLPSPAVPRPCDGESGASVAAGVSAPPRRAPSRAPHEHEQARTSAQSALRCAAPHEDADVAPHLATAPHDAKAVGTTPKAAVRDPRDEAPTKRRASSASPVATRQRTSPHPVAAPASEAAPRTASTPPLAAPASPVKFGKELLRTCVSMVRRAAEEVPCPASVSVAHIVDLSPGPESASLVTCAVETLQSRHATLAVEVTHCGEDAMWLAVAMATAAPVARAFEGAMESWRVLDAASGAPAFRSAGALLTWCVSGLNGVSSFSPSSPPPELGACDPTTRAPAGDVEARRLLARAELDAFLEARARELADGGQLVFAALAAPEEGEDSLLPLARLTMRAVRDVVGALADVQLLLYARSLDEVQAALAAAATRWGLKPLEEARVRGHDMLWDLLECGAVPDARTFAASKVAMAAGVLLPLVRVRGAPDGAGGAPSPTRTWERLSESRAALVAERLSHLVAAAPALARSAVGAFVVRAVKEPRRA